MTNTKINARKITEERVSEAIEKDLYGKAVEIASVLGISGCDYEDNSLMIHYGMFFSERRRIYPISVEVNGDEVFSAHIMGYELSELGNVFKEKGIPFRFPEGHKGIVGVRTYKPGEWEQRIEKLHSLAIETHIKNQELRKERRKSKEVADLTSRFGLVPQ